MNRSLAALTVLAAALVGLLGAPSIASAQLTATYVTPFGPSARSTIVFATQPISLAECDAPLTIRFTNVTSSPTMRFLDMWSASSATAGCETGMTRALTTSAACTHVVLTGNTFQNQIMKDLTVTAEELFGSTACTGLTSTRTFYVFDAASSPDTASNFTAGQFVTLTIPIDSQPPSPATISGAPAGDTSITVSWTNPSDIGTIGGVQVYFDPSGCGGGDGGSSSALVAGATPPAALLVYEQRSMSITSVTVPADRLGWTSGTYGQTGALAISVLDNAFNPSNLSNVVCASHVQVSGFWNTYCAERGLPLDQCTDRYNGCAVALPSRRADLTMLAAMAAFLGALFVRRRSR